MSGTNVFVVLHEITLCLCIALHILCHTALFFTVPSVENYILHVFIKAYDWLYSLIISFLDRLSLFRPHLIKRTSLSVLKDLLQSLQGHRPSVLHSREADEVLQGTRVLQDQVTCLLDMVLKKGEKACGITLKLLKELDLYLYEDVLQNLQASWWKDRRWVAFLRRWQIWGM